MIPRPSTRDSWVKSIILSGLIAAMVMVVCTFIADGPLDYLDADVHLCWSRAFHVALGEGHWPRWSANDFAGLGAPVFVFYAPLAHALAAAFIAMGAAPGLALNAVYATATIMLAVVIYHWMRSRFGVRVAIAIAVTWTMLPQLTLPGWRFNMPATALALAACASVLWQLERLLCGRRDASVWLALSFALVFYTHTLSALLLGAVLTAISAALLFRTNGPCAARYLLLALTAGTVLAAPHWLPAWIAADSVQLGNFVQPTAKRIEYNFLFAGQGPAPWPERDLIQLTNLWLLAALLLSIGLLARRREGLAESTWPWFALAALLAFAAMTPLAAPLYRLIEPSRFVQFGWRWQGIFALFALPVIAAALAALRSRKLFGVALLALMPLFVTGAGIVPGWSVFGLPRLPRLTSLEAQRRSIECAATPPEYLPHGLLQSELALLLQDRTPLRVVSGRAVLIDVVANSHRREYFVDAEMLSHLQLRVFASPGWSLTLDGVPIEPISQQPLVEVEVNAGQHVLTLTY